MNSFLQRGKNELALWMAAVQAICMIVTRNALTYISDEILAWRQRKPLPTPKFRETLSDNISDFRPCMRASHRRPLGSLISSKG